MKTIVIQNETETPQTIVALLTHLHLCATSRPGYKELFAQELKRWEVEAEIKKDGETETYVFKKSNYETR